jgi:hypothetical protein
VPLLREDRGKFEMSSLKWLRIRLGEGAMLSHDHDSAVKKKASTESRYFTKKEMVT